MSGLWETKQELESRVESFEKLGKDIVDYQDMNVVGVELIAASTIIKLLSTRLLQIDPDFVIKNPDIVEATFTHT